MNDANASIVERTKSLINKVEEKAKAKEDLNQAVPGKEKALLELEHFSNYNAELHQSCDFIMTKVTIWLKNISMFACTLWLIVYVFQICIFDGLIAFS